MPGAVLGGRQHHAGFGGALLLSARLADRHGNRTVCTGGLVVFAAGSLGCGLAMHAAVLLAARGVQGLGGAAIAASALVALLETFPPGRTRTRALGAWSAAQAGGGAAGWLLGGVVTQFAGWHWVFLGNVPPAVAGAVLAWLVLPRDTGRVRGRRLDLRGGVLVTIALFLLIFGLTELGRRTQSVAAVTALAAGCLALAGFVFLTRRTPATSAPTRR